ncbi:MAG: hypothetical protein ACRC1W_01240 [Shewanella sp.]
MKSTKHFLSAKPYERTDMVKRGYEHIAARMRLLSVEVKILNEWIKLMPALLADEGATVPELDFNDTIDEYTVAGDKLTDTMVQNALILDEFSRAILFYRKYDESNF